MTVEDHVHFALEGVSQTRVDRRLGLTFAAALRAIFDSDPDIVMVADLPDPETAELALEMAATGHLVLAQMTAKHTLGAITGLREAGVSSFVIGQTLAGALGQRLVRRVCSECAVEYEPSPELLQRFRLTAADGPYRRGAGCEACRQTGYRRRLAFYEILEVDDRLRQLIAHEAPEETLRQETFGHTGGSLWDDAREMILQGATTVEEAVRALFDYPMPASSEGRSK